MNDRLIIIGIDGAGNGVLDTLTPNIDRIMKNGVFTGKATTSVPTISGQCWGSMFHGVSPEKHGLTNSIADTERFPEDSPYPSFMKLAHKAFPDATLASFANWSPINYGIIEQSAGCFMESDDDETMTPKICDFIQNNDFKILYIHFDSVDGAGHSNGYFTQKHYEQITVVDGLIGKIYETCEAKGIVNTTAFIICSDHGGGDGGRKPYSHGTDDPTDLLIYWGIVANGINKNADLAGLNIRHTPYIVSRLLGFEPCVEWEKFNGILN